MIEMRVIHPPASERWLIAAAAFFMQLALGAVYGWSVFLNPLREHFGATKLEVNITFTITLGVLGITAGFGGCLLRRIGPRATATIAGFLYGAGVLLSGIAPNLPALYVSYGVIGGIGLGLGYIVPLAVLIGWFPDRRGFITGVAVAGFGLGALVTSPIATLLIKNYGVQYTLVLLGNVYSAIVVIAAQFIRPAPEGYVPPGWRPVRAHVQEAVDCTLGQALRTPQWHLMWWMLALNVTAGAAIISVAAPLVQEFTRVDATIAALAVAVIGLFNGVGRLFWGTASDWLGRARTFLVLFLIQVAAFIAIAMGGDHFYALLIPIAMIALCFGGGFGTMPAFTADVFGPKNAGTIYGAMLTAWSAGAAAGPMLIAAVPYRTAISLIAIVLAAAAILPWVFTALGERWSAELPAERVNLQKVSLSARVRRAK